MKYRSIAYAWVSLSVLASYCPDASAECSLTIQSSIRSGWNKEAVSYTVDNNTLKIKSSELAKDDTDSIYIGSIKGCSALTIDVLTLSGAYPWGGKAIGFSFANDPLEPHQWGNQASFPPPSGRAIEDGFIKGGLSNNTKLVYAIDNSATTMHIGAKVFVGSNNGLELQFSAKEAPREPQISARQPSRSGRSFAARADQQSDSAATSCALGCHTPRNERGEVVFTRDFSMRPYAVCPHDRD